MKLVASVVGAGDAVTFSEGVSAEELTKLDAAAKSIVLVASTGETITAQNAMLRYIAELYPQFNLLAKADDVAQAQVNQWLEFYWEELGKLLGGKAVYVLVVIA